MMDFNILNRATFKKTSLEVSITAEPGTQAQHVVPLQGGSFCLEYVEWKYSVSAGQSDYDWPKVPMQISIGDVIDRTASPIEYAPPTILEDFRIRVKNPSAIKVTVNFRLRGTHVIPIPGNIPLSEKEILGYNMLNDSQKGMLALQEAAYDRLDEHFRQLGVEGGIRNALLAGQISDLKQLPGSEPLALTSDLIPRKSVEDLHSLLLGDLVTYKALHGSILELDEIQAIAKFLLEKNWIRE